MGKALLVLATGLPLFLGALFLPAELMSMRDERAWRDRTNPFEYLDRGLTGARARQALMEIDALQRPQGLVSRLVAVALRRCIPGRHRYHTCAPFP
jgi:hypothetical protein